MTPLTTLTTGHTGEVALRGPQPHLRRQAAQVLLGKPRGWTSYPRLCDKPA